MSKMLQDVCELIVDSEHKTAPKDPGGPHPLIRTTDLGQAWGDFSNSQRVNSETYALWTRRAVPTEGDLILAREAPIGGVARVPKDVKPVLGQRTVLLRPDHGSVDGSFLLYRLAGNDLQAQMAEMSSGATVPHLNIADIRTFELPELPSLATQRRIASILLAFDQLAELNERRIGILDATVKSLFWNAFGSVSGSTDGDGTVASDLIEVNPRTQRHPGPYPRVTMADLSTRQSHVLASSVVDRVTGSRFERGDTLMARITPSLENGKTALALFLEPGQLGVGSTEFIVLRGKRVGPAFVYCAARDPAFRGHAIRSMTGASGRQRVANGCFDTMRMQAPAGDVEADFEANAMPMLEAVFQLRMINEAARVTRDLLLPRLVTGQLDTSDIDLGILTPGEPG